MKLSDNLLASIVHSDTYTSFLCFQYVILKHIHFSYSIKNPIQAHYEPIIKENRSFMEEESK